MDQFDLLIRHAVVYDGSGNAPYSGNVYIKSGKIAAISPDDLPAGEIVDAEGLALAPGFVDAHSHADQNIFADPERLHVLRQGVTTEIAGNCGSSLWPLDRALIDAVQALPLGPNQSWFCGFGALRTAVAGVVDRPLTPKEQETMERLLEDAMGCGLQGLTSGLQYVPDEFSAPEELQRLGAVSGKCGGVYASHMRSEARNLPQAVQELIDVGRFGHLPVHISHMKAVGPSNWQLCGKALSLVDRARAEGIDVSMDAYPYAAVSTTSLSLIPGDFQQEGPAALAEKLASPACREQLRRSIYETPHPDWDNSILELGFSNILIVEANGTPEFVGKTYTEAAKLLGLSEFDTLVTLLRRNRGDIWDVRFAMCEENIETILRHPTCMVGSDGIYKKGAAMCHPRAMGTFPRYLGHYIREREILPLAEGIRRITSMPADFFHLRGKGRIQVGCDADLVLFDKDRILDGGTYADPFLPNRGIHTVWMAGLPVLQNNEPTGRNCGGFLRRA